jgi:hypothetical protein
MGIGGKADRGEGASGVGLPAITRASQNVAAAAMLLDALPAPSIDRVGEVYQWLKSILGATITQQAERSLMHRVEASILLLVDPKDEGHRATQEALDVRMASSPDGFLTYDRPSRLSAW